LLEKTKRSGCKTFGHATAFGLLVGLILAQTCVTAEERVERIDFCEVLKDPRQYGGKEITVRATYFYWFEMSDLYCLSCQDKGKFWLSISSDLDRDSESELRKAPESGIVNLTVTGKFETGGTYGHLNGYQHELTATRVRNLVVLAKGLQSPEQRKQTETKWACGGRSPK
jgi:hypothetical protein